MMGRCTAPTSPRAAACAAECPAGTTCTAPQCSAGQELLAGGTSCTDCPAGTVNPTPGGACNECTGFQVPNTELTQCGGCRVWLARMAALLHAARRQGCLDGRRQQRHVQWRQHRGQDAGLLSPARPNKGRLAKGCIKGQQLRLLELS
jgi:hypothetical protein